MRRPALRLSVVSHAALAALVGVATVSGAMRFRPLPDVAPEFPSQAESRWAGPPVSLASQRGRVVLLYVWTFG